MTTMIKSGPNADVVHYNATRREDFEAWLAAVSRSTLRKEAVRDFEMSVDVAYKIRRRPLLRLAVIENAVESLYRVLQTTEES